MMLSLHPLPPRAGGPLHSPRHRRALEIAGQWHRELARAAGRRRTRQRAALHAAAAAADGAAVAGAGAPDAAAAASTPAPDAAPASPAAAANSERAAEPGAATAEAVPKPWLSAAALRKVAAAADANEAMDVLLQELGPAAGEPLTEAHCRELVAACLERGNVRLALSVFAAMTLAATGAAGSSYDGGLGPSSRGSVGQWPAATVETAAALVIGLAQALHTREAIQVRARVAGRLRKIFGAVACFSRLFAVIACALWC